MWRGKSGRPRNAERSHRTAPVSRSRQYTRQSCSSGTGSGRPLGAYSPGFGSSNSPTAVTVVRKTRCPQTTGLDQPSPGTSTTHSTFSVRLHVSGRSGLSGTDAFRVGPRKCGQLSFASAGRADARVEARAGTNRVSTIRFIGRPPLPYAKKGPRPAWIGAPRVWPAMVALGYPRLRGVPPPVGVREVPTRTPPPQSPYFGRPLDHLLARTQPVNGGSQPARPPASPEPAGCRRAEARNVPLMVGQRAAVVKSPADRRLAAPAGAQPDPPEAAPFHGAD